MRHAIFVDRAEAEMTTLGELLERYQREVTPGKRGKGPELSRMKRLLAHPLAMRRLPQLRPVDFTNYSDERRKQGASEKAIREELVLYSAVFTIATEKWSIHVSQKDRCGDGAEARMAPGRHARVFERQSLQTFERI